MLLSLKTTYIKNKYYVGFDFGYSFAENDKVKLIIDDNVFLR